MRKQFFLYLPSAHDRAQRAPCNRRAGRYRPIGRLLSGRYIARMQNGRICRMLTIDYRPQMCLWIASEYTSDKQDCMLELCRERCRDTLHKSSISVAVLCVCVVWCVCLALMPVKRLDLRRGTRRGPKSGTACAWHTYHTNL